MKSQADLEIGTQVGEYVIDGKLGEGGFGTVWRATHPVIGKLAAVKVLSPRFSGDKEMVSRFAAEARAVNQIRHRNIIDIFAFGTLEDGRSYYVMELLDGQPLSDVLEESGGMPLGEALPILREIARALDAAHAKGIAHRDLKPENVFLARDADGIAHPKLLDFGIAKLLGEASETASHRTREGAPIGTPYYMSPEQCRGQATIDHRTDIYSFGCLAYQLLTGALPFEGENHLEIMMKQTLEEPVPPSKKAADNPVLLALPPAVDLAIAAMMKKEPAERPASLAEAMNELERAAGFEPSGRQSDPALRLTPTPGRMTPMPRRTPAFGTTALAQTMASGEQQQAVPPKKRRLWPWLALPAAVAAGVVAVLLMSHHDEKKPVPVVAPAPVSSPTPTPVAAPEPPKHVTIAIAGVPAGTEVFGPSGPLGFAPGAIQLERQNHEVQLVLRAEGYVDKQASVLPDGDKSLTIELEKKPQVVTAHKPKPVAKPKPPSGSGKTEPPKPVEDPYARH